jgi:hypothetical protein
MANQDPHMIFTSKTKMAHACARITADRLPNDSVAAYVREADAACEDLYAMRKNLLEALMRVDENYQDAWEAAFQEATKEQE